MLECPNKSWRKRQRRVRHDGVSMLPCAGSSVGAPVEGTECVSLDQALLRVLAKDIVSERRVPPHGSSAMDGYALRSPTSKKVEP